MGVLQQEIMQLYPQTSPDHINQVSGILMEENSRVKKMKNLALVQFTHPNNLTS